ncbi:MAG: thiamine pyrophosphate-dependent dehydrogenase E1 component subunit alpha [Acidobacteriota bacterium]
MARLGKRQLHEVYYYLNLARRLEEEIARLHGEGEVPGPLCLGAGLEAVSLGAAYPLGADDYLGSYIPSVGSLIVRGVEPREILAHFLGKKASPSGGREGSLGLGAPSVGVIAPAGHLANHLGVMTGVAFAAKVLRKSAVAVAILGERAMATGDFHEGLNFAAVHEVPLVVVVHKNVFSAAAPSVPNGHYLYERTRGYGLSGLPVDGSDVLQMLQVVETAVERARQGMGPALIEARIGVRVSYALREDSVPAPFSAENTLRKDAVQEQAPSERQDPVAQFEAFLTDHGLLQPADRQSILERVDNSLREALRLAEVGPLPDAESLTEGVYGRQEPQSPVGSKPPAPITPA